MFVRTKQNFYFEELYRRQSQRVFRQYLFILKDRDKAEDFTQDIFLKLTSKLYLFHFESRFVTWLFRVTSNHCFEY
ncbi:RNA polymerase sigma factor [Dyadobacter frigoris]|uniref:RNA polymerase sigma-70 region 2 domain-containing protein n=1 Tax=Dyadobacter frigoris TaxID=2576211 RepID=A0A4U6CME9_9BACT|nr:hypothetical protein FDK13_33840 [Dyadobacter frigoris]